MTTAATPQAQPVGRTAIEARIATLKAKHDRMPKHWEARRLGVMRDIERLVDLWLEAT